ncbi:MAG TPA: hypothetical protein VGQ57_09415 [Polyangiaceae bacterium]|jgi:hypothetical protein|nr:hypothetical protein [Polyangiaceae bacterium]
MSDEQEIDGVSVDDYDDIYEQGHDEGEYRFEDPEGEDTNNIVFLTKLWGSTVQLQIPGNTPTSGLSIQVADVRMPEPLVCSVYFQADFAAGQGTVIGLQLDSQVGLGRTTANERRIFPNQPVPTGSLIETFDHVPLITYLANVTVFGFADPGSTQTLPNPAGGGGSVPAFTLNLTIQVAPITRAKVTAEHQIWGMALPGEADELDDEMEKDLQPLEPTHDQRAVLQLVINQLQRRLGRRPSPGEVRAGVARMEARQERRQQRQASPLRQAFIKHTIAVMRNRLGRPPSKAELREELSRHQVPE